MNKKIRSIKNVVLDDVFVEVIDNLDDTFTYKFIVSDSKLSANAPWTTNQGDLLKVLKDGKVDVRLRSTRDEIVDILGDQKEFSIDSVTKVFSEGDIDKILREF